MWDNGETVRSAVVQESFKNDRLQLSNIESRSLRTIWNGIELVRENGHFTLEMGQNKILRTSMIRNPIQWVVGGVNEQS